MQQCSRLSDGIEKINEASLQIDQLSLIVEEQRKNVVEAAQRCEQMLVGIESCRLTNGTDHVCVSFLIPKLSN